MNEKKIFLEFQKKKKFNSERKLTVKREEANTHTNQVEIQTYKKREENFL